MHMAEHPDHLINKVTWQTFLPGITPENVKISLRATGLWPRNPSAVPDSTYLQSEMYDHHLIEQIKISETGDAIESGLDTLVYWQRQQRRLLHYHQKRTCLLQLSLKVANNLLCNLQMILSSR